MVEICCLILFDAVFLSQFCCNMRRSILERVTIYGLAMFGPNQIPCRVYFGLGYVFPIGNSNPKIGNFTLDPWGLPGP
jgi:hypothetical protein